MTEELEASDWEGVHKVVGKFSRRIVKVVFVLMVSVGIDIALSIGLVVALTKYADLLEQFKRQEAIRVYERCVDNNRSNRAQHDLWDPIVDQSLRVAQTEEDRQRAQDFKDRIDKAYTIETCKEVK